MILTVLSDIEQYNAAKEKYNSLEGIKVLCDNPDFYAFLDKNNIEFERIDEDLVRQNWSDINKWACEKAIDWGNKCKLSDHFGLLKIDKSMYLVFSYILASLIKNFLYSEHIMSSYDFSEILVFKFENAQYPRFNGNFFLNTFLKEKSRGKGIKVNDIEVLYLNKRKNKGLKGRVKDLIQITYSGFSKVLKGRYSCVVSGSLMHLRSVISGLKEKGKSIALLDANYNLEKHIFAVKNNIGYFVPESFSDRSYDLSQLSSDDKEEIKRSLEENKFFTFNDTDLTGYVWSMVLEGGLEAAREKIAVAQKYRDMVEALKPDFVVLDEDISDERSFLAAFLKSQDIPVFCVSHGYMLTNFSVGPEFRTFDLSTTFVNSEFEKALYLARGWTEENIVVTGMPRYDGLLAIGKGPGGKASDTPMKILYCASSILEDNPRLYSYLGIHKRQNGMMIIQNLKDSMEAVSGKDIELIIKPHDEGEEFLWVDLISKETDNSNIKVVPAKSSFFDLLLDCDAMISSYWSAAINESAILNIPTIVADYYKDDNLHPDINCGLFKVVHNGDELKGQVNKLYEDFTQKRMNVDYSKNSNFSYYLGRCDRNNSERVVNYILDTI